MIASHVLQVVWLITDHMHTRSELIAEALDLLDGLAEQAHAILTGPPQWTVLPAAEVAGWGAYAPGLVLIGTAPADPDPTAPRRRKPRPNATTTSRRAA